MRDKAHIMQFQDLKVCPQITWPKACWEEVYDPTELEFRIEPSGEKIQKKLKKAMQDAFDQQKDELATAQEELAKYKQGDRDFTILSTKCNKTNTVGKASYEKGVAVLMRVPRRSTVPIEYEASAKLPDTYIASSVGRKRTQEDTSVADVFESGQKQMEVTAVFDGHGGTDSWSVFMKERLVQRLQEFVTMFNPDGITDAGIWNALKLVTVYMSREYQNIQGGTCANICLKIDNTLWVANLGDSRAILIDTETKTTLQLGKDQKAADLQYLPGIEKRKGSVSHERLDGYLMPARSVGDHGPKDDLTTPGAPSISARSKVTKYELEAGKSYLLIQCSDGATDTMATDHIGYFVLNRHEEPAKLTPNLVAAAIEDFASDDNIVVIIRALPIG